MTSENKALERIWLGRDNRYVGSPWLRLASDFDDEDEDGEVQEYVRADLLEASAAMASRQNALIDTLRDELAKENAKSARLVNAVMAPEDAEALLREARFMWRATQITSAVTLIVLIAAATYSGLIMECK